MTVPATRAVMNLGTLLTQTARRFPDRAALVWRERTWTWAQLEARVNAGVAALRARGVGKGDRILVHARNSNAMFESMWIAFKLGAIWVPTNYRLAAPEVASIARSSRPRVLLYDDAFGEAADAARASAGDALALVVAIGEARPGEMRYEDLVAPVFHRASGAGVATAAAVTTATAPVEPAAVEHDDVLWLFFTSGTTGRPKAAMLTHGQMAFVVVNHLCDLMPGTTEADASLVAAPLSHGAGIHALAQVARGAVSVLLPTEKLDPEAAWQLVERHRVTNLFAVPTIVKALVEHPAVDRRDHSSLRYVVYAGAPMYRADQKAALAKLGSVLVQYFGLGEVTGNITVLPPRDHTLADDPAYPLGSCGYARTGMEIAAFGERGERRAAGEPGELCVRGPAVFAGYYENPEANAKAFRDGWFRTGDTGYLDARGYVFITGRASDMYISGGSNVYPREIEEVLLTHPAIAEAAVVGVPHAKWGETGVAVLVKRPGADCSEADVLAHLDGKLARYKRPAAVVFWNELPKSGYGKVLKSKIAERLRGNGVQCPSPSRRISTPTTIRRRAARSPSWRRSCPSTPPSAGFRAACSSPRPRWSTRTAAPSSPAPKRWGPRSCGCARTGSKACATTTRAPSTSARRRPWRSSSRRRASASCSRSRRAPTGSSTWPKAVRRTASTATSPVR